MWCHLNYNCTSEHTWFVKEFPRSKKLQNTKKRYCAQSIYSISTPDRTNGPSQNRFWPGSIRAGLRGHRTSSMSSNRSSQMSSQLGNWAAQLGRLMGRLLAGWVTQGRSRQRLRNATQLVLGCHSKLQYLAATVHGLETQKLLRQCLSFNYGT